MSIVNKDDCSISLVIIYMYVCSLGFYVEILTCYNETETLLGSYNTVCCDVPESEFTRSSKEIEK